MYLPVHKFEGIVCYFERAEEDAHLYVIAGTFPEL